MIMNCALEIMKIKEIAETEYQNEQARLDYERRCELIKITDNTIQFCENEINSKLVECAKNRCVPEFTIKGNIFTDRIGTKIFSPLILECTKYANGTPSYIINTSKEYNVEVLTEYLERYCFNVEWKKINYKTYGSGSHTGYELIVTV